MNNSKLITEIGNLIKGDMSMVLHSHKCSIRYYVVQSILEVTNYTGWVWAWWDVLKNPGP